MIKKTYREAVLMLLTILSVNAYAQDSETAVKQVVNRLFDGMKKTDTGMIRAAFHSAPVLQTIVKNREGKTIILTEVLDSFLISVARPHSEIYDERISFDVIRIDGDLAIVWASYKFYIGEKFSHCGVDSFQLVRINGQWKILYLADTRRKTGCD